jgi:hypothetical protein
MIERKDVEAALEARRELGREYEPELIEGFLAKIEKRLDQRPKPAPQEHHAVTPLVLGSIALGIPITAIATSHGGAGGIAVAIIAWIAIAVANLAAMFRRG